MNVLHLMVIAATILVTTAVEDTKARGKRQQVFFRRGVRPPPYAVQMEPIVQYSQRDPLYNPLASSKSDDNIYYDDAEHGLYGGQSEPEPIIEIIIKESNESLPTPPPLTLPSTKPTKEPIQVFYVKYEKKDQGDGKSRVVYDKPVPALAPHEEHEEIKVPENSLSYEKEQVYTTPAPAEPSTTLRAVIRPDSQVYHAGSSGIRVTFGTEQLPPNNHNKRSDLEKTVSPTPRAISRPSPAPTSSKRQHGPYAPLQTNHHRVPAAFPQQRIVNSFPPQHQFPSNFPPQQFQAAEHPPRQHRPPITIQGLPEVRQRLPFQSFGPPHRIAINHPQQPGFPPAVSVSHQSIHLQNQPPLLHSANFNGESSSQHQHYKQQELEKQKFEQRREQQYQAERQRLQQLEQQRLKHEQKLRQEQQFNQEQKFRQEQHNQQFNQEQKLRQEQFNQEQKFRQDHQHNHQFNNQDVKIRQEHNPQFNQEVKIRQEHNHQFNHEQKIQLNPHEHKIRQEFNQEPQYNPPEQHKIRQEFNQQVHFGQQPSQQTFAHQNRPQQIQPQREEPKHPEVLKAVPKLEQHYAIRENPLHPGPFPPNPQLAPVQYPQQQSNYPLTQQSNSVSIQQQTLLSSSNFGSKLNQAQSPVTPKYQQPPANYQSFYAQNPQSHQRAVPQSIWGQVLKDPKQKIFATPLPKQENAPSSTPKFFYTTTTTTTTTPAPTTTTPVPTTPRNEARIKENIANLPDEVPDDIRHQLLSSGILGNADIQVLDYDKVGDIPIENLPPEALANFYSAGGGGAVAASAPVPVIAKRPKSDVAPKKATSSKVEQATLRPGGVEMKVVRFDPNTAQGQAIADQHIREDATRLKPVTVGAHADAQYNRYLPLKVSGTSFPIPDVPELKDRRISSVVVLAPVDLNTSEEDELETRAARKLGEAVPVKFLAGDTLKQLVKKPSAENYKKWLDHESRTEPQKQSVVLLVTTPKRPANGDKEIYMYDVTLRTVTKLSGDLSSAFVDAAESNAETPETIDDSSLTFEQT